MTPSQDSGLDGSAGAERESSTPSLILARSALLTGLCALIPLPFVDDLLRRRATRHLVASLLQAHGRRLPLNQVRPLYDRGRGCIIDALLFIVTLPIAFVVKLVKKFLKTLFYFLTLRDVALDVGRAYLLGHCVHRQLTAGRLGDDQSQSSLHDEARRIADSFDESFADTDRRILAGLLGGLFGKSREAFTWVGGALKSRFGEGAMDATVTSDSSTEASKAGTAKLEVLARSLVEMTESAEMRRFLSDFDARFDAAYAQRDSSGE